MKCIGALSYWEATLRWLMWYQSKLFILPEKIRGLMEVQEGEIQNH